MLPSQEDSPHEAENGESARGEEAAGEETIRK